METTDDRTPLAEPAEDEVGEVPRRLDADAILDTFLPATIDWRDTVRRYPLASVLAVGLVGYLVGRTKGGAIMAGMTTGLSSALTRQLSDVFEGEFFDFD
jgi:hypothetical protein